MPAKFMIYAFLAAALGVVLVLGLIREIMEEMKFFGTPSPDSAPRNSASGISPGNDRNPDSGASQNPDSGTKPPGQRNFRPSAHWKIVTFYLIIYDLITANAAYLFALWFRFDCRWSAIPMRYLEAWMDFAPVYSVFVILVFWWLRLYRSIWRFASYAELLRVTVASALTASFHAIAITVFFGRMPVSYYVFGAGTQFLLVLGIRFSYRFVLLEIRKSLRRNPEATASRVMLIGAGEAGQMILRDLHNARELSDRVVCVIDDNPNKWGRFIDGIPIVGGRDDILANAAKYQVDKIFLAIPSATAEERRDILDICKETGCAMKSLPGMYQFISGSAGATEMRDVGMEDLLGREPIEADTDEIFAALHGKRVLVTGGGGSIGSELARQIAGHGPGALTILDIYENNVYDIELELRGSFPELELHVLIGSVRDSGRLEQIFAKYRPEIVFHAAAHKHVPLMEVSPTEAIKNNAVGTYKTALAAIHHGVERFVLISTDKAVNPTNMMGASKRLCEMVIQTFDRFVKEGRTGELIPLSAHLAADDMDNASGNGRFHEGDAASPGGGTPATEFVAVRFGNVLGSNGSVIPIFKKQIERGGPVTVTHPDIIRYFMTIPEAVSLVLEAATYAEGGEIFVLDMGSPMKIDTLARNLIKLSGLRPDVDIEIVYTGLRPGEKLYEEKLMSEEGLLTTSNRLIYIGKPVAFHEEAFLSGFRRLNDAAYRGDTDEIRRLTKELVSTYHPERAGCASEESGVK